MIAGLLSATLVFVLAVSPSTSELQTKIRAALRSAKSFVVTSTIAPQVAAPLGATITYTYVAPNRYRQLVTGAPVGRDDTIIIGHDVYGNENDKGWTVQTWDDRLVNGFEGGIFDVEVLSAGDGAFVMRDPFGRSKDDTLQCTYDRATFRPQSCSGDKKTMTYARYDDPAVAIPAPPHAKRTDNR